ncbi:MAG: carbon-nitrogen hydrolase family protein [Myxococcales bacterium]|nr:carbon-nitrogen hydrolase family protein [Myxococcales bacterium]
MTTLRVAAVQVESRNGEGARNLARAAPWVARAAERGAQLVLCPEFLATGYIYDTSIWRAAERAGGLTERWLGDLARRHAIHVGASYLESDGDDFHNTFALAAPDGSIAGRVRKGSLPSFEGWYFRPCTGSKVIDTDFGRIGVGICNDNQTAAFYLRMRDERPDLILMPHSAPTVEPPLGIRAIASATSQLMASVARRYAAALGVPVVMSNKRSAELTSTPMPLLPLLRLRWRFEGASCICDGDGATLAELGDREGVIVADVRRGPTRTPMHQPSGYWSFPPRAYPRLLGAGMRLLHGAGRLAYGLSRERRRMARAIT